MTGRILWLVCGFLLLSVPGVVRAHTASTSYLEIQEVESGWSTVRWRVGVGGGGELPRPDGCSVSDIDAGGASGARVERWDCPDALAGHRLAVDPAAIRDDVVVWARLADGRTVSRVLTRAAPVWRIPEVSSSLGVASAYVSLGMVHIAGGLDHLLFLLLLLFTARGIRDVILAESAFTVSHSLSFAGTALGWIHVSAAAAEVCIASSLILLALDVERPGAPALSRWHLVGTALIFGFVHGLGFAGGLRELGLPDVHAASALAGFGLGVELGQIAFLALAFAVLRPLSRHVVYPRVVRVLVYGMGALAVRWFVERLVACVS